jgi:hypothetical protein
MLDQGIRDPPWKSRPADLLSDWREPSRAFAPLGDLAIADLRPTQVTVGFREVVAKRSRYRAAIAAGRRVPLQRQGVPIVLGPEGHAYALDRHHSLCALLAEGVVAVPGILMDDLSGRSGEDFWTTLNDRGWRHPYDADGRQLAFDQMPTAMWDLRDDPYRSLASALRRIGGFDKVKAPYSEFAWADFLRRRLDRTELERDFEGALQAALQLSGGVAARTLPGWRDGRLNLTASAQPKAPCIGASRNEGGSWLSKGRGRWGSSPAPARHSEAITRASEGVSTALPPRVLVNMASGFTSANLTLDIRSRLLGQPGGRNVTTSAKASNSPNGPGRKPSV